MPYSMNDATVLVVGGAGLIGSHITDLLLAEGVEEVRVFDSLVRGTRENLALALADPRCKLIEADVRDRGALAEAMAGCDYVFHLAAIRITQCAAEPRECLGILVEGTFNVFEAAAQAGVKKVVYSSSASVYGQADSFPTTETYHPYHNRTLYGAAKLMNEGIARHFNDVNKLPSVGLRYFNVYGPRMDVTGAYTEVFMKWLDCIEKRRPPLIHGDGSATMDLVYVGDVARANIMAMKADRSDTVYNVASGTETSLLQLWRALQSVTGSHDLEPTFQRPGTATTLARRLADPGRARAELGFATQVTLDEGLRALAAWRKAQLDSLTPVAELSA